MCACVCVSLSSLSHMCLCVCMYRFRSDPALANQIKKMEEEVLAGTVAPGTAADILVDTFLNISTL